MTFTNPLISPLTGPIISGILGGLLASAVCLLLQRWVPEVCNGKSRAMLIGENRVLISIANGAFFTGFPACLAIYYFGMLDNSDWRGFALGVGGGSILSLTTLVLGPMVTGNRPRETLVAYAISQQTPMIVLYAILTTAVAAFACAAVSLMMGAG